MTKSATPHNAPVLEQELGTLEVGEGVFRRLFTDVITGVDGVASLSRPSSGLFGRGGEAITVERGQGEVAFSVTLNVHYDVNIPTLAADVRHLAGEAVGHVTGYKVRAVSLTIDHILPSHSPAQEQEAPAGDPIPDPPPVPDEE